MDSNPQNGAHLTVCGFIPSHFPAFLGMWMWFPGCTFFFHLSMPLVLVTSLKPRATMDLQNSPRPRFMGRHHLPHIVFFVPLCDAYIQMAFCLGTPKGESRNCQGLDFRKFAWLELFAQTSNRDEVWSNVVALVKNFLMVCRTSPTHMGAGLIPDFLWLGVKLPIWLSTFLFAITCVANVQMGHASPY
jgi:hypothetical protein